MSQKRKTKEEIVAEYLKKKMGTQQQASDIFGLSRSGVEKIWKRYKSGGKRAVTDYSGLIDPLIREADPLFGGLFKDVKSGLKLCGFSF